jgi:hypothetical protein
LDRNKNPTHTSNFGVKLAEHCASKGGQAEVSYPGSTAAQHASATELLIAKLKPAAK